MAKPVSFRCMEVNFNKGEEYIFKIRVFANREAAIVKIAALPKLNCRNLDMMRR